MSGSSCWASDPTSCRMSANAHSAAVVGAGLAGLTAAYRLKQAGWDVQLFESSERAGGRVQTIRRGDFIVDTGASACAESYKAYFELIEELGMHDDIQRSSSSIGIFREGRVHELRLDHPVISGLRMRALSWRSKLALTRLAFDIIVAKLRGQLDYSDMRKAVPLDTESARAYSLRALGREVDDYLRSPIIRTMLLSDADNISKVELFSGVSNIFSARLYALRGGQESLPQRLAYHTAPQLLCRVTRVSELADAVEVEMRDAENVHRTGRFGACVVCCPLAEAMKICPDKHELLQPLHDSLTYTKAITVAVGTNKAPHTRAMLVQMPACEDSDVALLFLDHNKARDRAPAGMGLIGCQWEAASSAAMFGASDDPIVSRTLKTLYRVFPEVQGYIEFTHVTRWSPALPLTTVGAYEAIGQFRAKMDRTSRVQFAGDYMGEAGQNTVVQLGNEAAATLNALLPQDAGWRPPETRRQARGRRLLVDGIERPRE